MRTFRIVRRAAVGLACLGTMLPQSGAFAEAPQVLPQPKAVAAPAIIDVALTNGGTMTGAVVKADGSAVEGAVVTMRQGTQQVAQVVTDSNGRYAVTNLRAGVYQVAAGQDQSIYRVWAPETAPPSARPAAVLVTGQQVVRGQFGGVDFVTLTTLGAAITGVTLAGINYSKLNDLEDDVAKIPTSP